VPTTTPASALRVPRTHAFLHAQVDTYLADGDWTVTPERAALQCNDSSMSFSTYLGAAAVVLRADADWWRYEDRTIDNGFTHDICCWPAPDGGWYAVDFTAAQYGLTGTFALIQHTPTLGELAEHDLSDVYRTLNGYAATDASWVARRGDKS
jgi:hypothetical protein